VIVVGIISAVWLASLVLVIALCRAADDGREARPRPASRRYHVFALPD
jgi:hypothetical protein